MAAADTVTMDKIVSLARRRGFVFPSSEIYGGLGSAYDYGHYGVLAKNNVRARWLEAMIQERDDIVALDSAIILNPRVWEASGHVAGFSDPLVDCRTCKLRFRADQLGESACGRKPSKHPGETPDCDLTEPRQFHLMFETRVGAVEDSGSKAYLRPETAQGIFVNFKNVLQLARRKPPFGIAQIGKAFRNEITPGNFLFRTREFEQMEMEFFVPPDEADHWYRYWIDERYRWYTRYVPHVIEPAGGADRALLAFLVDAYDEEEIAGRGRTVLRLHPSIAPVKAAVLPLIGRDAAMAEHARSLYEELRRKFVVEYDDGAAIGRRYRRQDEIGTPFAFTVDEQTLADETVTVRDRDSLAQERLPIGGVRAWLEDALAAPWTTPKSD